MVTRRKVTVNLPNGLHLRPMTQIAQTAGRFASQVRILNGKVTADARSALTMMQLSAECGTELVIEADGDDAEQAVAEVARLFDDGFAFETGAANGGD